MLGHFLRGVCACLLVFLAAAVGPAFAQTAREAEKLAAEVVRLYQAGKFVDAVPIAKEALALREKALGPEHPDVGASLTNLAMLYQAQNRYAEAEPLYKRSLSIFEKAQHPDVAATINNLATLFHSQGKFADAEPLFERSLGIRERDLGPDHPNVAATLNNLAALYESQGRYSESELSFKRSLDILEKALGSEHPNVAAALNNLGSLYKSQAEYAKAEPLLTRSLSIKEKALGPNHPDVANSLNNLALLYKSQGKSAEAESLYKRSLRICEEALGSDHSNTITSLTNLASLYQDQGKYSEAELLYKRSVAAREKVLGPDHPDVANSLNGLAEFYRARGQYGDAERLHKRSLNIRERALGGSHPDVAASLSNLGELYRDQGKFTDAEPLYKRSIVIYEKARGADHIDVAISLNNLGLLYISQRKYEKAAPLFLRSLAIREKALGPDHPKLAVALSSLAQVYRLQASYAEAELLYKRSIEIWEKAFGPDHPMVAEASNNLAELYWVQGKYDEADPLYKRGLASVEKALGPRHPKVAHALNNVASQYTSRGNYAEAERLYLRSLNIIEEAFGPDHPRASTLLDNLAAMALRQHNFVGASDFWWRATAVRQRLAERGSAGPVGQTSHGTWSFDGLVKTTYQLSSKHIQNQSQRLLEMFETAQWARSSEAAASLMKMAARSARADDRLATLVRERQDIVGEWQSKDKSLLAAMSQAPEKRNSYGEKILGERLSAIDKRLSEIDTQLASDFPGYAGLTSPRPTAVAQVQSQLHEHEAMVLLLDTDARFKPLPEETFVWIITKTDARWLRSELGTEALKREVAALRCGLDATAWRDSGSPCPKLFEASSGKPLPFDIARAHALYKGLLGEAGDLIKGKHLLVVPSGALTTLPFQVLVTALPDGATAGEVSRQVGRLGAQLGPLSDEDRGQLPSNATGGVRVAKAVPGGPAEAAGLRSGDILLAVQDRGFDTVPDAIRAVQEAGPGSAVTLKLIRDGQPINVKVKLESQTKKDWQPLLLDASNASKVHWLIRDHAITVLPSVASLKALRRTGKPSAATRPIIGFGNPLLDGNQKHPRHGTYFKEQAAAARTQTGCAASDKKRTAALREVSRSLDAMPLAGGQLADLSHLRMQAPLPETADELCEVARAVGGSVEDVRIGGRATEAEVKKLSSSGDLATYRILHFATHGTLAGQLKGTTEPGLILTPPETATVEDDGFLSGSEIASLKLDADWVILSACNTAGGAGQAEAAEALSGLARVFFYAGARALLVSHWEVDSDAAVKLVTSAIKEMAKDKDIGRAEAMRRAMLNVMGDTSRPKNWVPASHPSVWAPFVVVGEGGAGR